SLVDAHVSDDDGGADRLRGRLRLLTPQPGYASVASRRALIVCIRFSDWSNTIDAVDSKTSSVTSISEIPCSSSICLPTLVSALWNAGRQCMNFVSGLPVAAIAALLTWYGVRSRIRSVQTSLGSPIETQTSVYRKSASLTPSSTESVRVIRAPDCAPIARHS